PRGGHAVVGVQRAQVRQQQAAELLLEQGALALEAAQVGARAVHPLLDAQQALAALALGRLQHQLRLALGVLLQVGGDALGGHHGALQVGLGRLQLRHRRLRLLQLLPQLLRLAQGLLDLHRQALQERLHLAAVVAAQAPGELGVLDVDGREAAAHAQRFGRTARTRRRKVSPLFAAISSTSSPVAWWPASGTAMSVMVESPSTRMPRWRAFSTSWTVDMPTASAPRVRKARSSARVA